MKKVKRYLSLLITAAILFTLTACGSGENPLSPDNSADTGASDDGRTEIVLSIGKGSEWDVDSMSATVNKFNRTNTKYKVVYGDYENESVLEASIVSGKGPDIFVRSSYNSLSYHSFSDFTYENLMPYLEADEECGVGVYEESLLNALIKNGSVYWLPVFYEIVTFIAPEHIVGTSQRGITMEQAERAAKELGDNCYVFPGWLDKNGILSYTMAFALGKYIDYETGVCNFDSPEFVALLENCNRQVDQTIINGEFNNELLERTSLLGICRIMRTSSLSYTDDPKSPEYFNMDPVSCAGPGYKYVGFPNEGGNGSTFYPAQMVAISSASNNKEGAWEFISFILGDEVQSSEIDYLPVNRRTLEKQIELGLVGKLQTESFETVRITQKDADKLLRLIDETEYLSGRDQVIKSIIKDEAAAFFDGAKSAEETARVIQSRVSIYVAEQR